MTAPPLIDAARAALDALGNLIDAQNGPPLIDQADEWDCAMHEAHAAIDALRAAIEAAESARQMPASTLTQTAPERIWLGVFEDGGEPFPDDHDDVTWCQDRVGCADPEYVRADLVCSQPEPAREPMTETEAWNCICSVGPSVFDLRLLAHLNQLVRAVEAFHRIGSEGETR